MRDLLDEEGENRAVRSFLALYGCNPGTTVGQMRQHLTLSGFPHWPEWVEQVSQAGHLTKADAQLWLRMLFALEAPSEPAYTDCDEAAKQARPGYGADAFSDY